MFQFAVATGLPGNRSFMVMRTVSPPLSTSWFSSFRTAAALGRGAPARTVRLRAADPDQLDATGAGDLDERITGAALRRIVARCGWRRRLEADFIGARISGKVRTNRGVGLKRRVRA